jgi:selenide,water dikinase|tara:strand:+ start:15502 stop:16452 length:951 start_codon:yes stop_codon:yes gene_type:complete
VRRLAPVDDPALLVGAATGDDAAVYRLDDGRALVVTADFITPVVDDARMWGRVAAANAVSDVYAMGGRPLLALNLVGWNSEELSIDLLAEVLLGAQDVASEGGFVIAGGHTVDDPEPKFGLAVVGEADPDRLLTNTGFRPGDVLVLTKPLGIGVITTAIKAGTAPDDVVHGALDCMTRLNAEAARVALDAGATGATDVTGFGLLGHLGRAVMESGVDAEIDVGAVPLLEGARALAETGSIPGGSRRNLAWVDERLDRGNHDELDVLLLADAQTSGGLVFGASPAAAHEALDRLEETGHTASVIGRVAEGNGRLRLA